MFTLPESPWTYENESLNPNLEAHNSRQPDVRRRKVQGGNGPVSSVPPYHPDYRPEGEDDGASDRVLYSGDSSSEDEPLVPGTGPRRFIRKGPEGYEILPINREAMLRQHIEHRMQEPGRYNVYVPEPLAPDESDSENEEEEVPLTQRVETWRAESAVQEDS